MLLADKISKSIENWLTGKKLRDGNTWYEGVALSHGGWYFNDRALLCSYGSHFPLAKKLKDGTILINVDRWRGRNSQTDKHQMWINYYVKALKLPYINISASAIDKFIHFRNVERENIVYAGEAQYLPAICRDEIEEYIDKGKTCLRQRNQMAFVITEELMAELCKIDGEERHYIAAGKAIKAIEGMQPYGSPYTITQHNSSKYVVYYTDKLEAIKDLPHVAETDGKVYQYWLATIHTTGEAIITTKRQDIGRYTGFAVEYDAYFLCGMDESQYFCAQLPISGRGVDLTPETARQLLMPSEIQRARIGDWQRQGEWFFLQRQPIEEGVDRVIRHFQTTTMEPQIITKENADNRANMVNTVMGSVLGKEAVEALSKTLWAYRKKWNATESYTELRELLLGIVERFIKRYARKRIALPKKDRRSNTHYGEGYDFNDKGEDNVENMWFNGKVKHSGAEHRDVFLEGLHTIHLNTEIDSATATSQVD